MKVMLAMSGGVDSSVAGALLLEQGHEVVGVTMRLWGGESDSGCCSVSDVDDARRVAQQLNIDHLVFNFSDDFNTHVVDPYVSAHSDGITPNPCIECNRHLKFDRLSERARQLGFDAVATGHHARIARGADGLFELRRGEDRPKDQSYVVHMLPQHELAFTLFPVGEMTKAEVRTRAAALNLRTATKPDSQDVCFITATGGGREAFLGHRIPLRRAVVHDTAGEQVGEVESIELVTLGQRRGLQLAGAPARRYVVDIDHAAGVVTVGDEADLLVASERVDQLVWSRHEVDGDVLVQCSAHGDPRPARLHLLDGVAAGGDGRRSAVAEWHEPQRRISPGQSAVFYAVDDDLVLGGGLVARP